MNDEIINILVEINKAVKTLKFYPSGHPNLENIVSQCYDLVAIALKDGDLSLKADQKTFYYQDKPIETKSETIPVIAKEFFLRKINQITFLKTIEHKDVQYFLEFMCIDPQEIADSGGSEKMLLNKGCHGIQLNETDFDDILDNEDNTEKEKEKEKEEEVVEEQQEEGQQEEEQQDIPGLAELLKTLENAHDDDLLYTDALIRIRETISPFKDTENFKPIFPAMIVLAKHTLPQYKLHEALKMKAGTLLKDLLDNEHIKHLALAHDDHSDQEKQIIEYILFQIKDVTIPLLLDFLVNSEEQNIRRNIYKILINFKDTIRPYIERLLRDEQWFVVRQMVTLLGDLGGERSILWLEKTYEHEDERVKKEVLKSLAKMPSVQTTDILIRATKEESKSLSGQAIVSLAMMKEVKAVDTLGEIASQKDLLLDHIDTTKEAIKALGIIGTDKAVEYLSKIALKNKWIGKETFEDLKLLAVQSLDKIGTPEAVAVLEKVAKKSDGNLHNTCVKILERRKSKQEEATEGTNTPTNDAT